MKKSTKYMIVLFALLLTAGLVYLIVLNHVMESPRRLLKSFSIEKNEALFYYYPSNATSEAQVALFLKKKNEPEAFIKSYLRYQQIKSVAVANDSLVFVLHDSLRNVSDTIAMDVKTLR